MSGLVEGVNTAVLRQCREQMALQLEEVEAKARIKNYAACESGVKQLTFKQIAKLGKLYEVPKWAFVSETLADDFCYEKSIPAFRQFANSSAKSFEDHKVRGLIARVMWMRGDIQDLRVDWQEPVPRFKPPKLGEDTSAADAASKVRRWLGAKDQHDFSWWRKSLEDKGVFTFVTSKRRSKFYVSPKHFRGLAIYYDLLPIVIINGAGKRKSKSSTLFYELGHLLYKRNSIDDWDPELEEDKWCEEFSNSLLMPSKEIQAAARKYTNINYYAVMAVAKSFSVSNESCIVRMRQADAINNTVFSSLKHEVENRRLAKLGGKKLEVRVRDESETVKTHILTFSTPKGTSAEEEIKKQNQLSDRRIAESLEQYGQLYAGTLFNAWSEDEIQLTTLREALGLQSLEQARDLRHKLR